MWLWRIIRRLINKLSEKFTLSGAMLVGDDGKIVHVGIILENNHIIHASGKVRIDRIDQQGIFNVEQGTHTHKLRLINIYITY